MTSSHLRSSSLDGWDADFASVASQGSPAPTSARYDPRSRGCGRQAGLCLSPEPRQPRRHRAGASGLTTWCSESAPTAASGRAGRMARRWGWVYIPTASGGTSASGSSATCVSTNTVTPGAARRRSRCRAPRPTPLASPQALRSSPPTGSPRLGARLARMGAQREWGRRAATRLRSDPSRRTPGVALERPGWNLGEVRGARGGGRAHLCGHPRWTRARLRLAGNARADRAHDRLPYNH